ncbi:Protein of unknown function [Bacillus cereus]|nr:Protein of unknown function [Bacillus cereus]
MRAFIIIALTF